MKDVIAPSSFTLFARKIKGKKINRVTLWRRFNNEVEKEDWLGVPEKEMEAAIWKINQGMGKTTA